MTTTTLILVAAAAILLAIAFWQGRGLLFGKSGKVTHETIKLAL